MRDLGSRFGQVGGAELVAIICMCSGMLELSSRSEIFGQGSCCSPWILSEMKMNTSRGVWAAQVEYRLLRDLSAHCTNCYL